MIRVVTNQANGGSEQMSRSTPRPFLLLFRGIALVLMIGVLAAVGLPGRAPHASAVDVPENDYLGVFERGQTDLPFAVLEKPRGARIGAGTPVEIQAFGLRTAAIDGPRLAAALRRLPELDRMESRILPPGFKVYADSRNVALAYADAAHTYKITFTSPADVAGTGGGGGGSSGSGAGGGGSM
jgi:hypothetical protein